MWSSEPIFVAQQPIILTLIVAPIAPALSLPVNNGDVVATLQGVWNSGAPFTGTFVFVAPNFDHGGDYAIVGNNLVINNAANINMTGIITVEHVTLQAIQ